ncbi:penicillin-binding transpeptidase domain-containing protein [Brevibacillus daliensis]|uniref:penicillin-binding transpeptidase domain-containing protein n=1 Tax=Brevibacillus daliensis TaxID=2892995 RepID=UPI001E35420B|nr:penicillin-binding transpeptidase domain-containing protein [Brevibacillus daliensis]
MRKNLLFAFFGIILITGGIFTYIILSKNDPRSLEEKADKQVQSYVENWSHQDFARMYEQLSVESKNDITKDEFIKRYKNIYEGIEVENLHIQANLHTKKTEFFSDTKSVQMPYELRMDTSAGPISFVHNMELVREQQKEKDDWAINWSVSLIFPGMLDKDKVKVQTLNSKRGEILDRTGKALATSGIAFEIGIIPKKWDTNSEKQKQETARLLHITSEELHAKRNAKWVKPELFVPLAIRSEGDEALSQLEEINGVMLRKKEVRHYPYRQATAHLVGYIGSMNNEEWDMYQKKGYHSTDLVGKTGVEQVYEEKLHGTPGSRIVITDELGIEKEVLVEKPVQLGQDITLTIDGDIQFSIYEELKDDAGTVTAIHPMTGEVLALVSTPAYDPNLFILGLTASQWKEISEDPNTPLLNRFANAFAPGSTFKPITAAIGLDAGSLDAEQEMRVNGLYWQKDNSWGNYYVTRVRNSKGPVNLEQALTYSDNIFFAQAALHMGEKTFLNGAERFGFGESIPFPYPIKKSKISSNEMKNDIQLADSAYGQGEVTMTPLHLALVYSAFLHDGNMLTPTLTIDNTKPQEYWKENVMTKETAQLLQKDLIQVMEHPQGTGRKAKPAGIRMAGKTGTAELKKRKGENGLEYGWMVAFNVEDSRLLLTIMVEDVKGRGGSHYLDTKVKRIFTQALVK